MYLKLQNYNEVYKLDNKTVICADDSVYHILIDCALQNIPTFLQLLTLVLFGTADIIFASDV